MNFEKQESEDLPFIYNYSYSDYKNTSLGLSERNFKEKSDLLNSDGLVKIPSQNVTKQNKPLRNLSMGQNISKLLSFCSFYLKAKH